jgi:tRNA(Arg) A34 adenosine deaminase TadA
MQDQFMQAAINEAHNFLKTKTGGPFGAVVVKDNAIIATGSNLVTVQNDPTAHAEIVAIRNACKKLNSFTLTGCQIYSSCEPCPMCLSAIYWSRLDKVYFAADRKDAAHIGFDDDFLYAEVSKNLNERSLPFQQIKIPTALTPFKQWQAWENKTHY